ncbi:hypothetical protein GGR54DRAFT_621296 [Hypoxylon sp. NC1633]|nr:hypothetical protein GGR54DRAFT_621296 [Hypoxylon sp. NC1633]
MSFGSSFLSKIGLGDGRMSTLLPLHTSPPPRPFEEHDLSEFSPRPDDALLSPDFTHKLPYIDDVSGDHDGSGTASAGTGRNSTRSKGKGKAIAFAYPDRPPYSRSRTVNAANDFGTSSDYNQETLKPPPGIWRPSIRTEQHGSNLANTSLHTSFVESIIMARPNQTSNHMLRLEVDNTFRTIQRREHQMHNELQKLLDAQGAALERDLEGDGTGRASSEHAQRGISPDSTTSTARSKLSEGSVVPVRQPRRKPISKRQARVGIARFVTMLADLKNEEDAYIAGALADRKTALSRLRNLSSKRKSITTEMKALEEDNELPVRAEIAAMEDQHRTVCSNISKLEERLSALRRAKADLERRLGEARSTRDSSLSGYKGALRQCEQGIAELMKYPGIQLLEVEDLQGQGEDVAALMSKHVSGFEFLSLRPERRTIDMAKDWWEGEVAVLEQRKVGVDKERAALEEGNEIWQQVLSLITDFETRLNESLYVVMQRRNFDVGNPDTILRSQYGALKTTVNELQKLHDYVEPRGWNLLIAAIGAELAHLVGLKDFLAEMIRGAGYDDGSITPRHTSRRKTSGDSLNLVNLHENGLSISGEHKGEPEDEELSRSVVRRWGNTDVADNYHDTLTSNPLDAKECRDESDDNEVPPGLLSEIHQLESEDEHHNDVPVEFLSMHRPSQSREGANGLQGDLRRESSESENTVPPDLLAESGRDGDDAVD